MNTPQQSLSSLEIDIKDFLIGSTEPQGDVFLQFSSFFQDSFKANFKSPLELKLFIVELLKVAEEKSLLSKTEIEESYRKQLKFLRYLDNSSFQLIINNISKNTLVDLLWYMKDKELIKKTFQNISKHQFAEIMDNLTTFKSNLNPDNCLISQAVFGREAIKDTLLIIKKLSEQGQILI